VIREGVTAEDLPETASEKNDRAPIQQSGSGVKRRTAVLKLDTKNQFKEKKRET
jgi:hypothetical protein